MTIFRTFTDDERAALKLHGLDTRSPSQLSDAFVLGLRYGSKRTEPLAAIAQSAPSPVLLEAGKEGKRLTDTEQREIFRNPEALMVLMAYHDIQQDQADSMGAECRGNAIRYEELKALGKPIVEQDPEIWSNDVLRAFGVVQPLRPKDQQ